MRFANKASPRKPASASGAYWMNAGVQLELRGDFQVSAFTFDRTENGAGAENL